MPRARATLLVAAMPVTRRPSVPRAVATRTRRPVAQAEPPRQSLLHDHAAAARPGPADEERPVDRRAVRGPAFDPRRDLGSATAASSWRRRDTGPSAADSPGRPSDRPQVHAGKRGDAQVGPLSGVRQRLRTSVLETGAISNIADAQRRRPRPPRRRQPAPECRARHPSEVDAAVRRGHGRGTVCAPAPRDSRGRATAECRILCTRSEVRGACPARPRIRWAGR